MKSTPSQNPPDKADTPAGIKLRDLPPIEPPVGTWEAILGRADRPASVERVGRYRYLRAPTLALAATVVLAMAVLSWRPGILGGPETIEQQTPVPAQLAQLQQQSQRLERLIGSVIGTDPAESALFYRIADLDSQLVNYPGEAAPQVQTALWQQRVSTLQSLAEMRRVRATTEERLF